MGINDSEDRSGRGSVIATVTDDGHSIAGAYVSLYRAPAGLTDCASFEAKKWRPDPAQYIASRPTDDDGAVTFEGLAPGFYIALYEHLPETLPECVEVHAGCQHGVCLKVPLGATIEVKYITDDCRDIPCELPREGDQQRVAFKFRGLKTGPAQFDVTPPRDAIKAPGENVYYVPITRAGTQTADWTFQLPARGPLPGFAGPTPPASLRVSNTFTATPRAAQTIGGNLGVSLQRTATAPTADLAHWQAIVNSTERLSFNHYLRFMDMIFCGDRDLRGLAAFEQGRFGQKEARNKTLRQIRSLPFLDSDAYRVLKVATEAFVMVNCGIMASPRPFDDALDRGLFERRDLPFPTSGLDTAFASDYLERFAGGAAGATTLPYLAVIRRKLPDIDIRLTPFETEPEPGVLSECHGILQEKLTNPCLLELIWSYWHEEGMLVQTTNAITRRFQNVRGAAAQDPLANLEIDPLRPLNNFLWGYLQDEQHRLTVVRRNYEYDHHYGLRLAGRAVQGLQAADTRSKFLEAFHNLLRLCAVFYRQDDDTTVKADAFPVLNALKEVHLILTEGQHNQFGDLPSTARIEMLMQEWLLARPEFREFLPTRIMVAYPEPWMDRVDAMKKLQGWTDTSVLHFRNLGVFGEQILLGIRWGFWSDVQEPVQAFNWARMFRPQIQGYIHAYRAVAGVDLTAETVDTHVEATLPSELLRKRLAAQQRGA
jgi:hypothetical protein